MKVEYHKLYTHLILVTQDRIPFIEEENRENIEKYITGIVNNNDSKLYSTIKKLHSWMNIMSMLRYTRIL